MIKTSFYLTVIALVGFLVFKLTDSGNITHKASLQQWAQDKIKSETAEFQTKHFTNTDLDQTYNQLAYLPGNMLIRFQITQGKISSPQIISSNPEIAYAYNAFHKFLEHMIKKRMIEKDVDFIVSISENITVPDNYVFTAPIIVPSKNTMDPHAKFYILAPHYKTLSEWSKLYDDILEAKKEYPWIHKTEQAFWRGSTSTEVLTRENWQDAPITRLLELSAQNPTLIDAKLNNISQTNAEIQHLLAEKYPLAVNVAMLENAQYKINIRMDNKASIYPGLLSSFLSGAIVLKRQSTNEQWFYDILEENKHYISFANDVSDLLPKIQWIHDHDAEAKVIANAGAALIEKEITPNHVNLYWVKLLEEHAAMKR